MTDTLTAGASAEQAGGSAELDQQAGEDGSPGTAVTAVVTSSGGTARGKALSIGLTTGICALFAALGQGVLWAAYALDWRASVPWQPVTGIVLVVVAVVAFGGFYLASRRARIAIAASFLLTFLVSLGYVLTVPALGDATQVQGAKELFADFRNIVVVIIGFYFGSEAAISMTKVIGVALSNRGEAANIQRVDRDLVTPEPAPSAQ